MWCGVLNAQVSKTKTPTTDFSLRAGTCFPSCEVWLQSNYALAIASSIQKQINAYPVCIGHEGFLDGVETGGFLLPFWDVWSVFLRPGRSEPGAEQIFPYFHFSRNLIDAFLGVCFRSIVWIDFSDPICVVFRNIFPSRFNTKQNTLPSPIVSSSTTAHFSVGYEKQTTLPSPNVFCWPRPC